MARGGVKVLDLILQLEEKNRKRKLFEHFPTPGGFQEWCICVTEQRMGPNAFHAHVTVSPLVMSTLRLAVSDGKLINYGSKEN